MTADTTFLRRTLAVDAATCAGFGALLVLFTQPLSELLGLPAALLHYAGIALFPCAALMILARTRRPLSRALAWLVVGGNAAWVLGSALVLLVAAPTGLGYAFVIAQAIAVAVLAELEFIGLRTAR